MGNNTTAAINIEWCFFTYELYSLLRQKEQRRFEPSAQTKLEQLTLERKIRQSQYRLSANTSRTLLEHCPYGFFDLRLEIISNDAFPPRTDRYLSLCNPRYMTTDFNHEIIQSLESLQNSELTPLIKWMSIHANVPWLAAGISDISLVGKPIRDWNLTLMLSDYIQLSDSTGDATNKDSSKHKML